MEPRRENIYTVPNAITMARLAATPYIGYLIMVEDHTLALQLAIVAGASDVVRPPCFCAFSD